VEEPVFHEAPRVIQEEGVQDEFAAEVNLAGTRVLNVTTIVIHKNI